MLQHVSLFYFTPFYSLVIFYYMYLPQSIPSSIDVYMNSVYLLAVVSSAALNICILGFICVPIFN